MKVSGTNQAYGFAFINVTVLPGGFWVEWFMLYYLIYTCTCYWQYVIFTVHTFWWCCEVTLVLVMLPVLVRYTCTVHLHVLPLTNRFHVDMHLFCNRSQMTLYVVRTKNGTQSNSPLCHWCSYHILTSYDCDLLLNRYTATRNLHTCTCKWTCFTIYNI